MKCNVGGGDRVVRLAGGVVCVALALFAGFPTALNVLLYVVGAIGIVTGVISWCPASALMGINTCKTAPPSKGGGEQKPTGKAA